MKCNILVKFSITFIIAMLSTVYASAEYICVKENYDNDNASLFVNSNSEIIDGDGENTSRFIKPKYSESYTDYVFGFETLDYEINGIAVVDFRAKVIDGKTYFAFDTRQNSDYRKTFYIPFGNNNLISVWRYYRILINFNESNVTVYSSPYGFDYLNKIDESMYSTEFKDATGFNMIRFRNCCLDDVSVYSGGSVPELTDLPVLEKEGNVLSVKYSYYDAEGDAEGKSIITWEKSEDGVNFIEIYGETGKEYKLNRYDKEKYIRARIKPVSSCYPTEGENNYYTEAVRIKSPHNYVIYDKDNKPVDVLKNEVYSLKANIIDTGDDNFTAIFAAYDNDGRLEKIQFETQPQTKDGTEILMENIDLRDIGSDFNYEVLYFNDFDKMNPLYEKDENESLYKETLDLLDLNRYGDVKYYYDRGDYASAIKEYRKLFEKKLLENKNLYQDKPEAVTFKTADDLVSYNKITLTNNSAQKVTLYMGVEGQYQWIHDDIAYAQFGTRMEWLNCLINAYEKTGDEKYLDKWICVWEDFDDNFIKQYEEYIKNNGPQIGGTNIAFLKIGLLEVGMRVNERLNILTNYGLSKKMNDVLFAKMIKSLTEDLSKMHTGTNTPNHFLYGYTALLKAEQIISTAPVKNNLDKFEKVFGEFIDNMYASDGGEQEMSIHYNYDMFSYYDIIKKVYQNSSEQPEWFNKLDGIAENKIRLLNAVVTPTKHAPDLAHTYINEDTSTRLRNSMNKLDPDEIAQTIYNKVWLEGGIEPEFTSIAFPYTGYYVMRKNWEEISPYIFFTGSRFGAGHVEMNRLSVSYSAFGEDLLISSPSSYSILDEDKPYTHFFESGFGNNTVTVDGLSQRRLIESYSDFKVPEDGLWHTSDSFDYADNIYGNGYNTYIGTWDERKQALISDVEHKRCVIMDKDNEIAIVADNMLTESKHRYIANWNFSQKFDSADMITTGENYIMSNENVTGAGIEIYGFSPSETDISIMCGETEGDMYKGWYLSEYGVNYKPCVHAEVGFEDNHLLTLIVPKTSSASKIKTIEEIAHGKGFYAVLADGTKITAILNAGDSVKFDNMEFSGELLYLSENPEGVKKGVAIGVNSLLINEVSIGGNSNNFEFLYDNEVTKTEIKSPKTFRWENNIPVYTD